MTGFLDRLNLSPGERRLVVGVAIVVFIALNFAFVFGRFGEWGRTEQRIKDTKDALKKFDDELKNEPAYKNQRERLQKLGTYVASEERAVQLIDEVNSQAALDQVQLLRREPSRNAPGSRTNAFFEEAALLVTFNSSETNLVNFLFNLGERNSLIRARAMQLGRDPSQTRLAGSITFVESFQKKPPPTLAQATPSSAARVTNPPAKAPSLVALPPTKASPPPTTRPSEPPKTVQPLEPPKTMVAPPVRPVSIPSPIAPKPTNLPRRVVTPTDKVKQP
jgi:hypothetical protein